MTELRDSSDSRSAVRSGEYGESAARALRVTGCFLDISASRSFASPSD